MTTRVLFLCPHSAGKSVFAATYFRAAAARLGIDAVARVAGTDPDAEIMPNVRAAIEAQGFNLVDSPRLMSGDDLAAADMVVSIGCDRAALAVVDVIEWNVPRLSEDFVAAMNDIFERSEVLARGLRN